MFFLTVLKFFPSFAIKSFAALSPLYKSNKSSISVKLCIGPHFNPNNSQHGGPSVEQRHYGDLGNIAANSSGRASFVLEDKVVKVWDIIGRSIAVTSERDDLGSEDNEASKLCGNSGSILSCAIIARSSGIFQNPKRICQCDGVSIWDETNVPASSL